MTSKIIAYILLIIGFSLSGDQYLLVYLGSLKIKLVHYCFVPFLPTRL